MTEVRSTALPRALPTPLCLANPVSNCDLDLWPCISIPDACKQETLLPQTDRATRYVSENLVNCRNKMYDKSTTNRMELDGYRRSTCSKQPRLVDCRIGVVNKLDRRRRRVVDNVAKFSKFQSLRQSSREMSLNFWRYQIFPITPCWVGGSKPPCQMPARFVQPFRYILYRFMTDGQTDIWRQRIPR